MRRYKNSRELYALRDRTFNARFWTISIGTIVICLLDMIGWLS